MQKNPIVKLIRQNETNRTKYSSSLAMEYYIIMLKTFSSVLKALWICLLLFCIKKEQRKQSNKLRFIYWIPFRILYYLLLFHISVTFMSWIWKREREMLKSYKLVAGSSPKKCDITSTITCGSPPVKLSWKFVLHAFSSSTLIINLIKCLSFFSDFSFFPFGLWTVYWSEVHTIEFI